MHVELSQESQDSNFIPPEGGTTNQYKPDAPASESTRPDDMGWVLAASRLQQIACQICQLAALTFFQSDMGIKRLANHPADQVAQAIGLGIEIRVVDLLNVAGEHDLGSFTSTGDDGFDFVRGEILGLVHNEEDLLQASATDIRQR